MRFVALLRGINVSGARSVKMAALKTLAANLGYEKVSTHLQSGNVVFSAPDAAAANRFPAAIRETFYADIDTLILRDTAFRKIAKANPFSGIDDTRLVVVFLFEPRTSLDAPLPLTGDERVELIAGHCYVHYACGQGRSKLNHSFFERRLKCPCTARNWRTIRALLELL